MTNDSAMDRLHSASGRLFIAAAAFLTLVVLAGFGLLAPASTPGYKCTGRGRSRDR